MGRAETRIVERADGEKGLEVIMGGRKFTLPLLVWAISVVQKFLLTFSQVVFLVGLY